MALDIVFLIVCTRKKLFKTCSLCSASAMNVGQICLNVLFNIDKRQMKHENSSKIDGLFSCQEDGGSGSDIDKMELK